MPQTFMPEYNFFDDIDAMADSISFSARFTYQIGQGSSHFESHSSIMTGMDQSVGVYDTELSNIFSFLSDCSLESNDTYNDSESEISTAETLYPASSDSYEDSDYNICSPCCNTDYESIFYDEFDDYSLYSQNYELNSTTVKSHSSFDANCSTEGFYDDETSLLGPNNYTKNLPDLDVASENCEQIEYSQKSLCSIDFKTGIRREDSSCDSDNAAKSEASVLKNIAINQFWNATENNEFIENFGKVIFSPECESELEASTDINIKTLNDSICKQEATPSDLSDTLRSITQQDPSTISGDRHSNLPDAPLSRSQKSDSDAYKPSLLPHGIVVKTSRITVPHSKMVAPIITTTANPCYLVKIPKTDTLPASPAKVGISLTYLNHGEKLQAIIRKETRSQTALLSDTSCSKYAGLEKAGATNKTSMKKSACTRKSFRIKKMRSFSEDFDSPATKTIPENLPFTSLKRKRPASLSRSCQRTEKVKAYELAPLKDPQMERCRKNAINAKKNRELKKFRMMELEREVEKGRVQLKKLAGENEFFKKEKEKLESRLKQLASILENPTKLSLILQTLNENCTPNRADTVRNTNEEIFNAVCSDP